MNTTIAISPGLTDDERTALKALSRSLLARHNITPIDQRGGNVIGVAEDIRLADLSAALEAHGLRLARDPHRRWGLRIERQP